MPVSTKTIRTSHADIALCESAGEGLPVLLIHGNSGAKEAFARQMESALAERYRMIAIDLPGHGESSDAFEPERTYSMSGYADAVAELLAALGIERVVVLGWSLGGHVALEMLPVHPGVVGVMIVGTPPVGRGPEAIQAGFRPNPNAMLAGKPDFTPEEVEIFAQAVLGAAAHDPVLRPAIIRTDGRARALTMANFFGGLAADQRAIAETTDVPIAVINGANDPIVDTDYVGALTYGNLWDRHCYLLRDAAHMPFREAPEVFNKILLRFLDSMEERARTTGSAIGRGQRAAKA